MTVIYLGDGAYKGLSSDTKPTTATTNAIFTETDTNDTDYIYDGTTWQQVDKRTSSSFIAYKAGSTTKVKNSITGKIDYSGTDATTVLNSVLSATKNTGQKLTLLSNNTFSLSGTLNLSSIQSIGGESMFGLARLDCAGDYPAITVSESSGNVNKTEISNLYITHNYASFSNTTGLVSLNTSTGHGITSTNIVGCYFSDSGQNKGAAINYNCNDAPIYKVTVSNCEFLGFHDQVIVNFAGTDPNHSFISNCVWDKINFWNPDNTAFMVNATSINQGFIGNSWTNCFVQSTANTQCGFDMSTNTTASQWTNNAFTNCLVWDLTSGKDAWKLNSSTEASFINCYPTYKIGGTGATNGKIVKYDTYSRHYGTATFSGNGSTLTFSVTTNLPSTGGTINPNTLKAVTLIPQTNDALGQFYVTSTDCSAFVINYVTAPPSGTNNLKYWYEVQS